ncbi:hypothetical protein [Microviridae sp.]|nr:hypothetical protein [Microviridae sp.]
MSNGKTLNEGQDTQNSNEVKTDVIKTRKRKRVPYYVNVRTARKLNRAEEINKQPSLTMPDMVLSLDELIKRHTRGQEIPILSPQYQYAETGENLMPELPDVDFDSLDKVGKLQLAAEIRERIAVHQKKLEKAQKAHKQKLAQEKQEAKAAAEASLRAEAAAEVTPTHHGSENVNTPT